MRLFFQSNKQTKRSTTIFNWITWMSKNLWLNKRKTKANTKFWDIDIDIDIDCICHHCCRCRCGYRPHKINLCRSNVEIRGFVLTFPSEMDEQKYYEGILFLVISSLRIFYTFHKCYNCRSSVNGIPVHTIDSHPFYFHLVSFFLGIRKNKMHD